MFAQRVQVQARFRWGRFAIALLAFALVAPAEDLQVFPDSRYVINPFNDGDSFLVKFGGQETRVRLYFADCPESLLESESDARRVREQMRYFGLPEPGRVIHFGKQAAALVKRELAEPFVLDTSFASAPGRSARGRIYGLITTARSVDLASLLVEKGLARAIGVRRQLADGTPADEVGERLRDLEAAAMLKRIGVWAESDPDRIAELRAEQRRENLELQKFQGLALPDGEADGMLDLNAASTEDLQSIHGVGPALAQRITEGRPYDKVDDLLRLERFNEGMLERIRPHVFVEQETTGPSEKPR